MTDDINIDPLWAERNDEYGDRFAHPWPLLRALLDWWRDRPRRMWVGSAHEDEMVCPTRELAQQWCDLWIAANDGETEADPSVRPGGWWRPSEIRELRQHESEWPGDVSNHR